MDYGFMIIPLNIFMDLDYDEDLKSAPFKHTHTHIYINLYVGSQRLLFTGSLRFHSHHTNIKIMDDK